MKIYTSSPLWKSEGPCLEAMKSPHAKQGRSSVHVAYVTNGSMEGNDFVKCRRVCRKIKRVTAVFITDEM